MATDVSFRCLCGSIRGAIRGVHPGNVNNAVCYCDDCQTWARLRNAAHELDANGGTHVIQFAPPALEITAGIEHLGLLRLSPKGLFRWYARCCGVPMFNCMGTPRSPAIGLMAARLELSGDPGEELRRLGKRHRVMGRYATGDRTALSASSGFLGWSLFHALAVFPRWLLRGNARHSPLFHAGTGTPIVPPEVVSREARDAARSTSA